MSNRVDELESRVSELQAAVDGLTEELVETRARLSAIEGELDVDGFDIQAQTPRARPESGGDEGGEESPAVEEANPQGDEAPDSEESEGDHGAESDSESETSDDIIVA
jgi:hypothetical protein